MILVLGLVGGNFLLGIARAAAEEAAEPAAFCADFPKYQDSKTGLWVYQISAEPGRNRTLYYHQYNLNDPGKVIYRNQSSDPKLYNQGYRFIEVDLKTGERTVLSNDVANGECVHGDFFYAFHRGETPDAAASVARQDLKTREWTVLATVPEGWAPSGNLTVSCDDQVVLFCIQSKADPTLRRVLAYHLSTQDTDLLYEGKTDVQHFQFSPTDPDVFNYYTQNKSGTGLDRIGMGSVRQKRMQPLRIAAANGAYLSKEKLERANFAHALFGSNGTFWCDVLWHPMNLPDSFGFVGLDLDADPLAPVPAARQELGFLSAKRWNCHTNRTTNPRWFVGDGDPFPPDKDHLPGEGAKVVSLFHLPPDHPRGGSYGAEYVDLAWMQGGLIDGLRFKGKPLDSCPHLVAGGHGAVVTWEYAYDGAAWQAKDETTMNVFLIQLPDALAQRLQAP